VKKRRCPALGSRAAKHRKLPVPVSLAAFSLAALFSFAGADARQSVLPSLVRSQAQCRIKPGRRLLPAQATAPPTPEIIDSAMTLDAALSGAVVPDAIRRDLTLISVSYWSFDGRLHRGQLVIHKDLAAEAVAIFRDLRTQNFPIACVVPIAQYGWSDDASMAANNTSCFNYRVVPGQKKLSNHAFGRAIDINPVQNPFMLNGLATPPGAVYDPAETGAITDGPIVRAFEKRGWRWGGRWRTKTDWQHFDKMPALPGQKKKRPMRSRKAGRKELPERISPHGLAGWER
jgi:peptidoglycan L-alanyl-D-glutamate endopeptidase CwlK